MATKTSDELINTNTGHCVSFTLGSHVRFGNQDFISLVDKDKVLLPPSLLVNSSDDVDIVNYQGNRQPTPTRH